MKGHLILYVLHCKICVLMVSEATLKSKVKLQKKWKVKTEENGKWMLRWGLRKLWSHNF